MKGTPCLSWRLLVKNRCRDGHQSVLLSREATALASMGRSERLGNSGSGLWRKPFQVFSVGRNPSLPDQHAEKEKTAQCRAGGGGGPQLQAESQGTHILVKLRKMILEKSLSFKVSGNFVLIEMFQ